MKKKIIAIDSISFYKLKLFKLKYRKEEGRNITYAEILARILASAEYEAIK